MSRNEVWLMIHSDGGWISSVTCFSSILPFWIESVRSEQLSQNKLLTSNDTDSGKTWYTKVIDNFDTFPSSIYTPVRRYCWKFLVFRIDQRSWPNWCLSLHPSRNRGGSEHRKRGELPNLSKKGYSSRFRYRMKKFLVVEARKENRTNFTTFSFLRL
jgi:hypothetical protein